MATQEKKMARPLSVEDWKKEKERILGKLENAELFQRNVCRIYTTIGPSMEISINDDLELCYNANVKSGPGKEDQLMVVTPNRFDLQQETQSLRVEVIGKFGSKNIVDDQGKGHLQLFVYDVQRRILNEEVFQKRSRFKNFIFLDGYICKPPIHRITPLGKEVTDLMVVVNYRDGSSDYIPCITWYEEARMAAELDLGDRVRIYGYVRSRQYHNGKNTAYEVSVRHLMPMKGNRRKKRQ